VHTATLVVPLLTPSWSLKRTKIRLVAGLNGTAPLPVTKTLNVLLWLASIDVVTLALGSAKH
jgi:hypothetical protein